MRAKTAAFPSSYTKRNARADGLGYHLLTAWRRMRPCAHSLQLGDDSIRLRHRRRRHRRLRAGEPPDARTPTSACCCSRPAAATITTGSTSRSAISTASTTRARIGGTGRAPSRGSTAASLLYPRGRVLGGSSSINGMIYMRGQREDYDGWAQAVGDASWRWDEVLPLFKRSEDHYRGATEFHGAGGEWRVEAQRLRWEILEAFARAAAQSGIPTHRGLQSRRQFRRRLLRGQPAPRRALECVEGVPARRSPAAAT